MLTNDREDVLCPDDLMITVLLLEFIVKWAEHELKLMPNGYLATYVSNVTTKLQGKIYASTK